MGFRTTKFDNSITDNTDPDIATVGTWTGGFAELDALDPTPSNSDKSGSSPAPQATVEVGGTSYGVPWYVETRWVYWPKDIAAKVGLTDPPKVRRATGEALWMRPESGREVVRSSSVDMDWLGADTWAV